MSRPASLRFVLRPRVRLVLAWLVALAATAAHAYQAWHSYDSDRHEKDPAHYRADGNHGHTLIDFGGQWLMARMLVSGHGQELYLRPVQHEVLTVAYPRTDEAPGQDPGDAE